MAHTATHNTVDLCMRQLPRPYQHAPRVRNDVASLLLNTPSLSPKIDTLTFENGAQSTLLSIVGTLPIWYMNNQYNIPVRFWIVEMYPMQPPLCYVTPTQTMAIKDRHPHVDRSGRCYAPYITQWNAQASNLVSLSSQLGSIFGQNPPVYERPASRPVIQPQPQQPYPRHPPHTAPQVSKETQHETTVKNAIDSVSRKLQARLVEVAKQKNNEIDVLFDNQHKLESRSTQITSLLEQNKKEKEALEGVYNSLVQKDGELSKWLEENVGQEIDIDKVVEARDTLSQQILELVAEENSIEDTLYVLDQALHRDLIDLDDYLKLVRGLSRDKFFKKALIKKVVAQSSARR